VYSELLPPELLQVYYLNYFSSGSVPELVQARLRVPELVQTIPELVQVRVAQH